MTDPLDRLAAALEDHYRIERELGAGGMATVYLAEDLKHQRKVAIKVLRPDLAMTLGPDRFVTEIRTTANLQHPHILPLYDSGEAGGFLYYVMPYVEGPTLRDRLTRERELPVSEAARILRDVADAMAAAHAKGVVHRDLKPENVMLSGRHAMVADFGVAKAVSEATGRQRMTTEGVALGTPTYMAPEQAAADPLTDHRADIYALGVVAYEMLTGQPPFVRATGQALLAAHVTEAPVVVTERRASIPPALAALIMRCLEKKPADRWQHADELLPILEGLATPSGGMTPTGMQPVTVAARPVAGSRRRVVLGVAATLVVVAGAVGAFTLWWAGAKGAPRADDKQRIVVAWFDDHTGDPDLADVGSLVAEWITTGLAREGGGTVIPAASVRELMTGDLAGSSAVTRELTARTGATVLVTGRYDARGDSLEYRAEVIDVATNQVLASIGPIRGRPQEIAALDALAEQVFMALDFKSQYGFGLEWQRPASLQAYREYVTGYNDHFAVGRQLASVPFLNRAVELDSMWLLPRGMLVAVFQNSGRYREADSIIALAKIAREKAPLFDQLLFEWTATPDNETQYRVGHRLFAVDSTLSYQVALPAARTGRFRETLEFVALRDTTLWWTRAWGGWSTVPAAALHGLGDFEGELAEARMNVERRGTTLGTASQQARPLAALGRTGAVDSLYDAIKDLPDAGGNTAAGILSAAGWEYLGHGHDEALWRGMFQRRLEYYRARPAADQVRFARAIAESQMMAGQLAEARALLDSLSAAAPDNVGLLGLLGVAAALGDDAATAGGVLRRLEQLGGSDPAAQRTVWRSRISALLGDCTTAGNLLREALSHEEGFNNATHHQYAALGRARECTGLQAVLAPRN